jgi:hypothetical protein
MQARCVSFKIAAEDEDEESVSVPGVRNRTDNYAIPSLMILSRVGYASCARSGCTCTLPRLRVTFLPEN